MDSGLPTRGAPVLACGMSLETICDAGAAATRPAAAMRVARVRRAAALAALAALAVCALAATAAADIAFERTLVELETDGGDGLLHATYPFANSGDSPVRIERIKVSCGCMGAREDDRTYAPGESGEVAVSFDPRGRSGLQRKIIRVYVRDGERKRKHLLALEVHIQSR